MGLLTSFTILASSIFILSSAWEVYLDDQKVDMVAEGDDLWAPCKVLDLPAGQKAKIQWSRQTAAGFELEISTPSDRVKKIRISDDSYALLVSKAAISDNGRYTCKITVKDETKSDYFTLTVKEKVEFTDCAAEQHPAEGEVARIKCIVSGNPVFYWSDRDGAQITADSERGYMFEDNDHTLVIPNFDSTVDNGIYTANAINSWIGERIHRKIDVQAYVAPVILKKPNETEVTGMEDSSVDFDCSASGRPEPEYQWFRVSDGNSVQLEATDKFTFKAGRLTVEGLNAEDEAQYKCTANNEVGRDTFAYTLKIFKKPRIQKEEDQRHGQGMNIQLRCAYSGDGELDVVWSFKGQALAAPQDPEAPPEGRVYTEQASKHELILHIDDLSLEDADEYRCIVSNDAGSVEEVVNVQVTRKPAISSWSEGNVRAVRSGPAVSVFCLADGVPTPDFVWYGTNGEEVDNDGDKYTETVDQDGLRSTLAILATEKSDFGSYVCQAKNDVGSDKKSINIIEVVTPPVPEDMEAVDQHPTYANVQIGNFVDLDEGENPQTVTFYFIKAEDVDQFDTDEQWLTKGSMVGPLGFVAETTLEVMGLEAKNDYLIRALATNEAGSSQLSDQQLAYTTSDPEPPAQPIFISGEDSEHHLCRESTCQVEWEQPNNHGMPITNYRLVYQEVALTGDGEHETVNEAEVVEFDPESNPVAAFKLEHLRPNTYYLVQLSAFNDIGEGEKARLIVKTDDYGFGSGVSSGAIVGIVIIILLVVLVLIDVSCYYVNQCGILMYICVHCCGRPAPDHKQREIVMEEGARADDKAPLQQTTEDRGVEHTEASPMIDDEKPMSKNTTV